MSTRNSPIFLRRIPFQKFIRTHPGNFQKKNIPKIFSTRICPNIFPMISLKVYSRISSIFSKHFIKSSFKFFFIKSNNIAAVQWVLWSTTPWIPHRTYLGIIKRTSPGILISVSAGDTSKTPLIIITHNFPGLFLRILPRTSPPTSLRILSRIPQVWLSKIPPWIRRFLPGKHYRVLINFPKNS